VGIVHFDENVKGLNFIQFKGKYTISAMTDDFALIGYREGHLQLVDPNTAHIMWQMNGHTSGITCIVYCSDLSRVITGSLDSTTRVWDVATGECVHVLEGHTGYVLCAAVHGTT
jgi:WD40 repeat protein